MTARTKKKKKETPTQPNNQSQNVSRGLWRSPKAHNKLKNFWQLISNSTSICPFSNSCCPLNTFACPQELDIFLRLTNFTTNSISRSLAADASVDGAVFATTDWASSLPKKMSSLETSVQINSTCRMCCYFLRKWGYNCRLR